MSGRKGYGVFFMQMQTGDICQGKVSGIVPFGAFVELEGGGSGLVHISEVSSEYVEDVSKHLKIGQEVKVKVLGIDEKGKISLSIKKAQENNFRRSQAMPFRGKPAEIDWNSENSQRDMSFEDMMASFKQSSDARMLDIKRNVESKRGSRRK